MFKLYLGCMLGAPLSCSKDNSPVISTQRVLVYYQFQRSESLEFFLWEAVFQELPATFGRFDQLIDGLRADTPIVLEFAGSIDELQV